MTALLVEVQDFVTASRLLYGSVGEPVRVGLGRLGAVLASSGGMAGADPGGVDWARSYDGAAESAMRATGLVVNAAYRASSMFGRSGLRLNYAQAEVASTASVRPSVTVAVQGLPPDGVLGPVAGLPSAAGDGSGTPNGWWLVAHTVGFVWPNGHQDRLRAASVAWLGSAVVLEDVQVTPSLAALRFVADGLPEAQDMLAVCSGLATRLGELATAHRSLAGACSDLASHLDECHAAVIGELEELLAWSVAIQAGGAVLSAVSFGAAQVPTQAVQAAKIAAVAARVGRLIERFLAAARVVAASVASVGAAAERVRAGLATLASSRLTVAGVSAVPAVVKSGRVVRMSGQAGKGVRLSKDARTEIAAAERLAKGAKPLTKLPARLVDRPVGGPGVWSSTKSLARHFEKHGREVGAASADEYAARASDFLQRALHNRLPRKVDPMDGTIRVMDLVTKEFASFRADGSAITYFKSTSATYLDRQPGVLQ